MKQFLFHLGDKVNQADWHISAVPLPATLPLFATGLAAMFKRRRKVA